MDDLRNQWAGALAQAEKGRPATLAALISNGVPRFAIERLAAYVEKSRIKNLGRTPKRDGGGFTEKQKRGADAAEYQWGLKRQGHREEEAARLAREQFPEFSEARLRLMARKGVKSVNDVLRSRGRLAKA